MIRVALAPEAARDLDRMPRTVKLRVLGVLERLERWPSVSGAKPLRGALAGHFRIRTGDYRVQFRVQVGSLLVERIGHRARFYEDQE